MRTDYEAAESDITLEDLIAAGLIVHPQAAARRMEMGKRLGIGYCNGKQFYNRCRMFRITREEFAAAWQQLEQEEG